jgi:transposase-like protein
MKVIVMRLYKGRQRYKCRACNRTSYGVPNPRKRHLSCPACGAKLWENRQPDGRTKFRCSKCGKTRMSAYNRAPHEASKVFRYRELGVRD